MYEGQQKASLFPHIPKQNDTNALHQGSKNFQPHLVHMRAHALNDRL